MTLKVWNGSAWVVVTMHVWVGDTYHDLYTDTDGWIPPNIKRWDGSTWV